MRPRPPAARAGRETARCRAAARCCESTGGACRRRRSRRSRRRRGPAPPDSEAAARVWPERACAAAPAAARPIRPAAEGPTGPRPAPATASWVARAYGPYGTLCVMRKAAKEPVKNGAGKEEAEPESELDALKRALK